MEREGRQVLFKAFPYANLRSSVWAFLERQGVRWLYPDDHGDYVPAGQGVNLDVPAAALSPSAARCYANFDMAEKTAPETNDPAFLFWWRNGYNSTWGNAQRQALGSGEVPPSPHGFLPGQAVEGRIQRGLRRLSAQLRQRASRSDHQRASRLVGIDRRQAGAAFPRRPGRMHDQSGLDPVRGRQGHRHHGGPGIDGRAESAAHGSRAFLRVPALPGTLRAPGEADGALGRISDA